MNEGDFNRWARACVDATADLLSDEIPAALGPTIEGAGQAITTAPGYQSRYIGLRHPQFGKISLWIYVVPPSHAYSGTRSAPQLATGVMRSPQMILGEAEGQWRFGDGNPFRWRTLLGGWESYLLMETVDLTHDPSHVAERFVPRVLLGLQRADLIAPD
jgi:hypothetical protein